MPMKKINFRIVRFKICSLNSGYVKNIKKMGDGLICNRFNEVFYGWSGSHGNTKRELFNLDLKNGRIVERYTH